MKWLYLGVAGISAVGVIGFLLTNQDILVLICLINCLINAVFYSFNTGLELRNEEVKEQKRLIEALRRKVDALEGLIRAIEEREQLDYEYLKKRDNIIGDTVNKIETERQCGMKLTNYTFKFKGGEIRVRAFNEKEATILAQAEAIKRGWDYEIQKYGE